MAFTFKINNVDRSAYVERCGLVPYVERNRDFTPIAAEFTAIISDELSQPQKDDTVYVYKDSTLFFSGYIKESKYIYADNVYRIRVSHILNKLKNYVVSYGNLHTDLSAGLTDRQYLASDNQGYPGVQLIWVIENLFLNAGLDIDLSAIESVVVENISFDLTPRQIQVKHLRLDENMLYALNQNIATNHTTIDGDPDYRASRITFFDLFQFFCSYVGSITNSKIGFQCLIKDTDEVKLFLRSDDPVTTITDAATYDKETDKVVGVGGGYQFNHRFSSSRADYASASETSLTDHETTSGDSANRLDVLTNFVPLYEKFWDTEGYVLGMGSYPDYTYPPAYMVQNQREAILSSWNYTKWLTDATLIGRVKSLKVDIISLEETAEIIQEIKV